MNWQLINSDVIEGLRQLPDASVHCVVTSPPYFGLRDYGVDGQIGLEATPDAYIARLVEVFQEVRRVLRNDGTLWINIGDSYAGSWGNYGGKNRGNGQQRISRNGSQVHNKAYDGKDKWRPPTAGKLGPGLKPKDLCGIPWRLAFALQNDGWWLRSDIIWSKPNGMTESVEDRPTKAHEYIFLLTKRARYFYDNEAVKEPAAQAGRVRADRFGGNKYVEGVKHGHGSTFTGSENRNCRSVWTMATQANHEAHFATFPKALPEICIKAGTSERGCCAQCGAPRARIIEKALTAHDGQTESAYEKGSTANRLAKLRQAARERGEEYTNATKTVGWQQTCKCADAGEPVDCTVLDPFAGISTTGIAALMLGRRFIGIELSQEYYQISERRLREAERQAYGDLFLAVNGGAK